MMVIGFQLSTVSAKAESFFFRLCRLLPGTSERWTLGVECSMLDVQIFSDSDLLSGHSLEIGNSLLAVGYSYEATRSLITSVSNLVNHVNPVLISAYDYANDELGRRTSIARSGLAFGDLPVRDAYGYNSRSEVTSARRTPVGSQTEIRGFAYDYEYDPIGNRVASTEYDHEDNALESSYTANALNQYEQRTVPGYAGVRGSATNTAVVTVNGNPTWRLGEYFYGGDDADNSADAVMKQLEITAVQSNLYSAVTGRVFVAQTPEGFTYDNDGNLTQEGRFGYVWNGENRLIKAETRDDLPTSVPRVKVEYAYDHQGRRVFAATATWTNNAWQAVDSRAFLYDGWNVATELTHSQTHTLTNCYIWGLDLSGSLQGAGGIGGLLAASLGDTTVLYCYDANGNVGQLVGADGELLAHYEYSPFGETVVATGPLAKPNPFRFSTKWFDNDTGLGDWGYRWYSSSMGRWSSGNPIREERGLNRYAYTINSLENRRDVTQLGWGDPVDSIETPPRWGFINIGWDDISPRDCPATAKKYLECGPCKSGEVMGKKQNKLYQNKTNGCGPMKVGGLPIIGGGIVPNNPSKLDGCTFLSACDAHDCCFGHCGTTVAECDDKFKAKLKEICEVCTTNEKDHKKCQWWADKYVAEVKKQGGADRHAKSQKQACDPCCCE